MPARVEVRDFVTRGFQLGFQMYLGCLPHRSTATRRGCAGHVAHPLRSIVFRQLPLRSTATLAAVPDMSLIPFAPFENLRARFRIKIRRGERGFQIRHLVFR